MLDKQNYILWCVTIDSAPYVLKQERTWKEQGVKYMLFVKVESLFAIWFEQKIILVCNLCFSIYTTFFKSLSKKTLL